MKIHSIYLSHVATGVAMGGLTRPARQAARVLHRAPDAPRLARVSALLAAFAMLGSCSSSQPLAEPAEPSNSDVAAAPATPDDDNASAPGSSAEPSPDADELAAVWEQFHAAWVGQAAANSPDPAAFETLATDPDHVVDALIAQRGESRLATTETELWPQLEINGARAEIVDCVIVTQHPDGQPDSAATVTVGWDATAVATDDGWRIEDARQRDLFCIADDLNAELVGTYTDWLEAHAEWYEPPDPTHPLLDETMAEPGLSDMRQLLADDRDAAVSMRFPHDPMAVVTEVGLGTARISDCYLAPDGYGAFDVESGERRTDVVPAPEPGQVNRTVADLEQTEDGWRVVGWRWEEQNTCQPGETRYETR